MGTAKGTIATLDSVLADPCASDWLKTAIREAMRRDCVDAVADARLLHALLRDRADAILSRPKPAPLPPLFPLRDDVRPADARNAAGRFASPGLFD